MSCLLGVIAGCLLLPFSFSTSSSATNPFPVYTTLPPVFLLTALVFAFLLLSSSASAQLLQGSFVLFSPAFSRPVVPVPVLVRVAVSAVFSFPLLEPAAAFPPAVFPVAFYYPVVPIFADPGWTFSGWSVDLTGDSNPETITMDGDKTVNAPFT